MSAARPGRGAHAPLDRRSRSDRPERERHEEGLGSGWDACRDYWADPSEENKRRIGSWLHYEGTKNTYLTGLSERLVELVPPEPWELDRRAISRDHGLEAHWELSTDYQSHVARFDEVLAHHRAIPTHLLDAGHFLLETHSPEFLAVVRPFVARLAEESSS